MMITVTNPDTSRPKVYYVTVKDAGRTGFLLGPYDTHAEALANVNRGKEEAENANAWAHFYAFGTASLDGSLIALPKSLFGV